MDRDAGRTGEMRKNRTGEQRRYNLQRIQKQRPLLGDQLLPHDVWAAEDVL